jgi:hypothetical protein
MSQRDPIRVFVTHCFEESDDYARAFEFFESARNFYYRNCSAPDVRLVSADPEGQREELRRQIALAEVVIALACLYSTRQDLLLFELNYAKASDKPVVLLPHFGHEPLDGRVLKGLVDQAVPWDERALIDAVRRQARHEETARWDTIEFKLD